MTKLLVIILLVLVAAGAVYVIGSHKAPEQEVVSPTPTTMRVPSAIADLIYLEKPSENELEKIRSPLTVSGRARGLWYFEASFPVKILDGNDKVLVAIPAQAQGDWMTQDFVPFTATLNFEKPTTQTGTIVLQKDNPSGLPENEAELRVPIRFDLENWPISTGATSKNECKPTGCSGQICSDQSIITTCEYKEEYSCFKTAKCQRQEDGNCGWTPTEQLVACLGESFKN